MAVAQSSTLTRASKQLGLAQPSLSQQLAKLEESVGTMLFDLLALQVAFQHLVNHNADSQTSELLWLQRSVAPSVRPSNGLAVLGSGNKRHTVVRLSRISDKLGRSSARPQRNTKRGTTFLADSLTVAERAGRPR
jgi:hypothetical protein